jgi:hypothetical protein
VDNHLNIFVIVVAILGFSKPAMEHFIDRLVNHWLNIKYLS